MSKKSQYVIYEKLDDYAVIRFNRTERKNGIIPEMNTAVSYHLESAASDDDVKLVVLTGTGEYFTSGADFIGDGKVTIEDRQQHNDRIKKRRDSFQTIVESLINFPKPIIVAVNGPAIGMGVTILPLCDVVYASSDATFLTPFSRIAMNPEACSSYTFPIIMGYAKANEMLLFNRQITANEACDWGLVTQVFPKEMLMSEVKKRVKEFVDNPAKCLVYSKQLIRQRDINKLFQVHEEELERLRERSTSEDAQIQRLKFLQKRKEIKERRRAKL